MQTGGVYVKKITKFAFSLAIATGIFASCIAPAGSVYANASEPDVSVGPLPQEISQASGQISLSHRILYAPGEGMKEHADTLAQELELVDGSNYQVLPWEGNEQAGDIVLETDTALESEEYTLDTASGYVEVSGKDAYAVAFGTSTLLQLVDQSTLPALTIRDYPDTDYRAVMIDVSRRYISLDSVKKVINLMRLAKCNYLHLHLTDDQNWMMPIEGYDKLGDTNYSGHDTYTKAELEDLVSYAEARGVKIIPEMDVPAHATQLVQAYPEVFQIQGTDISNVINFASEEVRSVYKEMISQTLEIFHTTPYYHIGGDEASYGSAYQNEDFIKAFERLEVEATPENCEEVYRDFINEMDAYVQSLGRQTIAWEGFGRTTTEDKVSVSKDVILINWEHIYYGINEMLEDGYTIINSSWSPFYLVNHYPQNNVTYASPQEIYEADKFTFGQVTPGYPGYDTPYHPDQSYDNQILGSQLTWWEGMDEELVPTMRHSVAPFGAKQWNTDGENNFSDFQRRQEHMDDLFIQLTQPVKYEATNVLSDSNRTVFDQSTQVTLSTSLEGEIRYTTDGSDPTATSTRYEAPLSITSDQTVKAALFHNGEKVGVSTAIVLKQTTLKDESLNLAYGKPVTMEGEYEYPLSPASCVTDGVVEDFEYWYARRNPQSIVIDLGETKKVGSAKVYSDYKQGLADRFTIEASADGINYETIVDYSKNNKAATQEGYEVGFLNGPVEARYFRLTTLKNNGGWCDLDKARIMEVELYEKEVAPEPESDNLALNKDVTLVPMITYVPDFERVAHATDGILDGNNYVNGVEENTPSYIQIDFGKEITANKVKIWHYATGNNRIYNDVVIQFSNDPEFKSDVVTVFNNDQDNSSGLGVGTDTEYVENFDTGKTIEFSPVQAQYMRCYNNGFKYSADGEIRYLHHWQEVEVYAPEETLHAELQVSNGLIQYQLSKGLPGMVDKNTFEVVYRWDNQEITQEITEISYIPNDAKGTITLPKVEPQPHEQTIEVLLKYQGTVIGTGSFTVPAKEVTANKTLLQKTYDYAVTLSTDGVTESAATYFEKVLAEAKQVLDNPDVTQQQVDSAWNNLLEGIWGLGLTQGDKTMLELVITRGDEMVSNADKYVDTHWQELVDALNTAKQVLDDGDAMQEEVDEATQTLLNAILAQRYKADKSILEDLINQAEGINLDGYTADSVAVFRAALAEAQAVMADETLSEDNQATVDAAVAALNVAMDGLTAEGAPETTDKPQPSNNPETTDKPEATEKPENVPQTGDSHNVTILMMVMLSSAVCAGAVMLAAHKRKSH